MCGVRRKKKKRGTRDERKRNNKRGTEKESKIIQRKESRTEIRDRERNVEERKIIK
jgi:hypothetical protein